MRVLIRLAYGLASVFVFGVMAMSSGGGHHRIVVLALGVLIGVILFATTDGADGAGLKGRFALRSGKPAAGDGQVPPAEG